MTREEMIDWIVDELLKSIREDAAFNDYSVLADYLREGFHGIENYTDVELKEEYEERIRINKYMAERKAERRAQS